MRHPRPLEAWTVLAFSAGAAALWVLRTPLRPAPPAPEPMSAPADPLEVARSISAAVVELAEEVSPAVVQVKALRRRGNGFQTLQDGSGVIVREEGIVVTNAHVTEGASDYRVVLTTGVRLNAELLARDPEADLAVLRISEKRTFEALSLSTQPARAGQTVLALGSPFGLGHSVTSGIVCGLGRSDLDIATYEDFLQIDAVINPGFSGGPLLNLSGEVVGINTAVGLERNGDDGIAFAIPAQMVRKTLEDILQHGRVVRGWIGVEPYSWFDPLREKGYSGVSRVKVRRFPNDADSPAQEAGIQVGDILESIDGRRLVTRKDLLTAVATCDPGAVVDICVWRKGKTVNVPVKIQERVPRTD